VRQQTWPDLGALSALGFGPDAALMTEPKLFVDRRFLAALLLQFEQELGGDEGAGALFQIGLLHGLRDAYRVVRDGFVGPGGAPLAGNVLTATTPLAIQLGPRSGDRPPGALEIPGAWPECHEADARLARVGRAMLPSCALSSGYTSGWLSGALDADILALETECAAQGRAHCRFIAREVEAWRGEPDPRALDLIEAIHFESFRDLAMRECAPLFDDQPDRSQAPLQSGGEPDPDGSVVHVWGPVMVMPFITPEEALQAVDLLSRDPGNAEIRAVVVDLRGSILDEGFGASALEQVLDTIQSWGAEAVLTGVAPVSEEVVRGLETTHLLVRKDLPAAIASAFQIAEAQRHVL
jgi:hypothetical protein